MYELFYIIPTKYTEDEVSGVQGRIASILEKNGAQITNSSVQGKQKLAYSVKKFKFGHRVLVEFNADGAGLKSAQRELALESGMLRYALCRKVTNAKSLQVEERKDRREVKVARPTGPQKLKAPAISEAQLEKEIEKALEEPTI